MMIKIRILSTGNYDMESFCFAEELVTEFERLESIGQTVVATSLCDEYGRTLNEMGVRV